LLNSLVDLFIFAFLSIAFLQILRTGFLCGGFSFALGFMVALLQTPFSGNHRRCNAAVLKRSTFLLSSRFIGRSNERFYILKIRFRGVSPLISGTFSHISSPKSLS
jgi:hypothetical protein